MFVGVRSRIYPLFTEQAEVERRAALILTDALTSVLSLALVVKLCVESQCH